MKNKISVLITGASSGIGKACALYLDNLGYKVFAGIRDEKDGLKLKNESTDRLEPIILDVTKPDTIASSVNKISQETEFPLFALVNNAGLALRGVLEVTHEDELRKLFDVNVIGLHAVTRAFLPLLRNTKGRIINIGSENCFKSDAIGGSYAASKYAVRAISDSLRLELKHLDMHVSLIAPTSTHSSIWDKMTLHKEKLHSQVHETLKEAYDHFFEREEKANYKNIELIDPIEVAKCVEDAIISNSPQHVYPVGANAKKTFNKIKPYRDFLIIRIIHKIIGIIRKIMSKIYKIYKFTIFKVSKWQEFINNALIMVIGIP